MKWRVMVGAADGTVQLHEVSIGECTVAACSVETLGLSIADGTTTLAGLHCRNRRRCLHCGAQRPLSDFRTRRQHHAGQADEHADDAGVVSHQGLKRRTGFLVLDESRTRVF